MSAFFEKPGFRSSMKAGTIIILLLLLLIPLGMIKSQIRERSGRSDSVTREIISGAGGKMDFLGPIIVFPYDIIERSYSQGEWIQERKSGGEVFIVPDSLDVRVELRSAYRSRGIYRVPVYDAVVSVEGVFPEVDENLLPDGAIPLEDEIRIFAGFADMRGIKSISSLRLDGKELDFHPDGGSVSLGGGISVHPGGLSLLKAPSPFSWNMELSGGGSVSVTPLGRDSRLAVSGDWPSPSFSGAVLPTERNLDDLGFSASWSIPEVSRPIAGHWDSAKGDVQDLRTHALTVTLMEPVGTYSLVRRSVQYGVLFLLLPFIVFFLFETFGKTRIHPVQYLLAGAADVLFYLLLLAISEHLGFNAAYLIAAFSATALLSLYSLQITGRSLRGLAMPSVLAAAYIWLRITLQSEDYALLIGAVGLFVLVAMVMFITRKVEWYGRETSGSGELGAEGKQGQPGQLEVLLSERDSDDGDEEDNTHQDMAHSQFPSEKDNPDNIADGAAGAEVADDDVPAERPEDE